MITKAESKAIDELLDTVIETRNAQQSTNPILDALDDLSHRYPEDTVSIFVNKDGFSGKVQFSGYILYRNRDFDSVMGDYCATASEAVEKVTLKAGARTKAARIAKRLAELQQEMDRLNAEAKETA